MKKGQKRRVWTKEQKLEIIGTASLKPDPQKCPNAVLKYIVSL